MTRIVKPPRPQAPGKRRIVLRHGLRAGIAAGLAQAFQPLAAQGTSADPFPSKPVRLIVSYAPGNITDVLARVLGQALAERWQQPVVIENRPGQGGSLGAQSLLQAPADGHVLLLSAMAAMAINPHVYPRVGYQPLKDFQPVCSIASAGSGLLYTQAQAPYRSFAELLAWSRAHPGVLNYGSAGSGTAPHLNMEALKRATGLDARHVPYKAAVAVLNDVIGGQIQLAQESVGVVLPHVRSGKLRALAVVGSERLPALREVPTVAELVPGFDAITPWLGLFGPAAMPAGRAESLDQAIAAVLARPDVREKIEQQGMVLRHAGPAAFRAQLERDHQRLGSLVRALDLKPD